MKINNWILHSWWMFRLRKVQRLAYRMKMETEALVSSCVLDIQNDIVKQWMEIKHLPFKLDVEKGEMQSARINRDEFGAQTTLPNPVYTLNEISRIKRNYRFFQFIIYFFPIAESALNLLFAPLFVPGQHIVVQAVFAIFLTLCMILAFDFGLKMHTQYREAKDKKGSGDVTDEQFKLYKEWRVMGIGVLYANFVSLLLLGVARIFFVHSPDVRGLDAQKSHDIGIASFLTALGALLLSFIVVIVVGALKQRFAKTAVQFDVYRKWNTAYRQRTKQAQRIIDNANALLLAVDYKTEKYFQLNVDLKRTFLGDTEHDEKYTAVAEEYVQYKRQTNYSLNDEVYRKFNTVQCAFPELFRYAVLNHEAIKEKVDHARFIQKLPKEQLEEYLASFPIEKEKVSEHILFFKNNNSHPIKNLKTV